MADYDPDRLLTERPSDTPTMTVRPRRKSDDDNGEGSSLSPAMREILTRIKGGESGGRYDVIYGGLKFDPSQGHPRIAVPIKEGPNAGKTSSAAGAYQFIGSTWDKVAAKTGRHDMSKASQDINAAQLARDTYKRETGRDIEEDWSTGSPNLRKGIERALASEWESLGKPGPRVEKLPSYRFSDYAMKEHDGRSNTDVLMMSPQQYLDLSPELDGKPFENPSGRALKKSFDKGDEIESIPSLDVRLAGPRATVTDQDGRHRALLAQQEGVEAIPVAVRKTGEGDPKEIAGMSGKLTAMDFPKAAPVGASPASQTSPEAAPKEPVSLEPEQEPRREPVSLFSRAEAAEPKRDATGNPVDVAPKLPEWMQGAQPVQEATPTLPPEPVASPAPAAPALPSWMTGAQPVADQQVAQGRKPVAEMSQEEAKAANLSPEEQRAWVQAQNDKFLPNQIGTGIGDLAGAIGRGVAPYAAGAAAGAAMGAPAAGVGAIPGAIAGAGAVGLTQLATGLMGAKTPSDATNAALTSMGVREPGPVGRVVEQASEGAANAVTGAGAMGQLARFLTNPLSRAVANVIAEHKTMQAVSGGLSGAASQTTAELGAPVWAQQLAGLGAGLVPGGNALAPNRWRIKASQAAKEAIEAGFVLPPAEATEGHIGAMNLANTAAAEAGKIKTGQQASAINQPRVNVKVQQELEVPAGTPLTPSVLEGVRSREGKTYREVQNAIPEVNLARDPEFRSDVAALGKRSESTEKLFPSTKEPPEVPEMRKEMLRHAQAPTKDVMNYIADLRARANQMFRVQNDAMAHRKGFAMREAATALEDALERSVQNAPEYFQEKVIAAREHLDAVGKERVQQGLPLSGEVWDRANADLQGWVDRRASANAVNQNNQTLLDRFRDARQTMAKSYDVEAVTNPSSGDVSATGLGRLLKKGKPLTGNLKVIADAANHFHRAFQNPAAFGGVEPLSVLDAAFAASQAAQAAATGNLWHAAVSLGTLMRPRIRGNVLSDKRQTAMISPHVAPSAPLSALTTPLLGTQPTGNGLAGIAGGRQ